MVNAPEKPGAEIPGEDELAGIFDRVQSKAIQAYRDEVRDKPLISHTPEPAGIEKTGEIPELEVTEWRLSNGIRVILKPTAFKLGRLRPQRLRYILFYCFKKNLYAKELLLRRLS